MAVRDIVHFEGEGDRPACVFVHGLGMDSRIWIAPLESRLLGGLFPLKYLLKGYGEPRTLYHDLMELGHTVAAWSQSRPTGPMDVAVAELAEVMGFVRSLRHKGMILIGHSRGGLIARKYLSSGDGDVRALITLATPHRGSRMAEWAGYLSPLAAALKPFVPKDDRKTLAKALRRMLDFLESNAVRELLPGSPFFDTLNDNGPMRRISVCGTDPTLFSINEYIAFPLLLERVLPRGALPEETRAGLGDGLVSRESAVMPRADEHFAFGVNHASIVVDPEIRKLLVEKIGRIG